MKKTKAVSRRLTEGNLKWWDYLIFAVTAVVCFLCFQQTDLLHTVGCSVGYLNGHFLDFYDYCGSCDIHPSYLPTVYLLFAFWNLPMKLAGVLTVPTDQISVAATMWAKLLPCGIYLLSGFLIYDICGRIGMGSRKSKYCAFACLTMPIAFFDQFIFGQYDIFMTVCVLLGIRYYLKKKDLPFILWFAVAVTFKYTALVIFLPLLLLRQKNVWRIFASCVLLMIPLALEYLLYRHSAGFSSYVFGIGSSGDNPTGYIFNAGIFTGFQLSAIKYEVSLVVLVYGVVLGWAYFTRPENDYAEVIWMLYFCCLSFFALFGLAKWHPQWLLFAVPFWVISAFLQKDTKIFLIIDLLFMGFFVVFLVQTIPNNVDQSMINQGILSGLVNGRIGTKVMMSDLIGKLDPGLCLSIMSMIMLVYAVFKHPKFMAASPAEPVECMGWMRTRFLLGTAIFVLPAFACLYAALRAPYAGYDVERGSVLVDMTDTDIEAVQRFCSTGTELDKLQFTIGGVYGQQNVGVMKLTLYDCGESGDEETILYEYAWETTDWVDGEIVTLKPGGIPTVKGRYYEVKLELLAAADGYRLALSGNEEAMTADPEEYCTVDGERQKYQLAMIVYQQ